MATKFKVWIDTPQTGTNIQSMADFSSDSQRTNGFAAGNAASAIRMNSALREATLITTALMDAIAPNSDVDITSTVAQVKTTIANAIGTGRCITTVNWNNTTFTLSISFTDGTTTTVDMSGIKTVTMYGATRDGNGNVINTTYATNASVSLQIQDLENQISQLGNVPLYMHEGIYIDVPSGPSGAGSYKVDILTTKDDSDIVVGTQYNFNTFAQKFKILSIRNVSTYQTMPTFIVYNQNEDAMGLYSLGINTSSTPWTPATNLIAFESYVNNVSIRWTTNSTIKTFANYYEPTDQSMPI